LGRDKLWDGDLGGVKLDDKIDNNKSNDVGISMHVIQLYLSFS
jgi:hypothetical protein